MSHNGLSDYSCKTKALVGFLRDKNSQQDHVRDHFFIIIVILLHRQSSNQQHQTYRNSIQIMSIKFSESPVVIEHLSRDDFSDVEHRQTWYSKKELSAIKKDTKKTITWIMGGMNGNRDLFCPIGLEFKTPSNLRKHQLHKEEAIRTVLQAQSSKNDPEWVAKAYATYSNRSMEEAMVMASAARE